MNYNKPIHVIFNNFWPGFVEGTNPNTARFFVHLFERVFRSDIIVEHDVANADILCEHAYGNDTTSLIYKKKWLYSILVNAESMVSCGVVPEYYVNFSVFLSGLKPSIPLKRVKFPLCASYLYCNSNLSMTPVGSPPNNLVCAVISNPKGVVRNKFLDFLERRTTVYYGGNFRNNIGFVVGGDHNSSELLNFIRHFKFVVTMENNEEDYYITEKICNGFFAGTVPIYWGSPNVTKYFNKNRFLHLENDSDEEIIRIVDKIIEMDDITYMKMVYTEVLVNKNAIGELSDDICEILNIR